MAEHILMTSMQMPELIKALREVIKEEIKSEFAPLRKQFEDRMLDIPEVCDKLGVSNRTLYNLEQRGELLPIRIGRSVKYRESDIVVYLRKDNQ